MCKSGRGWLTRRGWLFYYISVFLIGGGLNTLLAKHMGVVYKKGAVYKSEYGIYCRDMCLPAISGNQSFVEASENTEKYKIVHFIHKIQFESLQNHTHFKNIF